MYNTFGIVYMSIYIGRPWPYWYTQTDTDSSRKWL